MKYLKDDAGLMDADSADDASVPIALHEARVRELQQRILELPPSHDPLDKAHLQLQVGGLLLDLERKDDAWDVAREAFDAFVGAESWEGAVRACDIMFGAEQPESLAALGQGIWLAVTYPIDPELTVAVLQHVVDETPPDSDGAAVAAAAAHYIVELRAEGKQREDLLFFTNKLLGAVARRHSNVEDQEMFDFWVERMELKDPAVFLPRLRRVIDVMVDGDWWIDHEALQAKLPVN